MDYLRRIQRQHMKKRIDISYHFAVDNAGRIYELRDEYVVGAHCRGNNKQTIGIVWLGGLDARNSTVSISAKTALDLLIKRLSYDQGPLRVVPHSERKNTACPGDDLRAWITEREK
jgi:N-acetylmuramoyl-L-alanine amidase